ncbi:MAG: glycoside hydrolase family 30 protein [Cryomorphaceae bacterium]
MRTAFMFLALACLTQCTSAVKAPLQLSIYQTSKSGDKLKTVPVCKENGAVYDTLRLFPDQTFQTMTGFGGAFTESSAYVLNQLSSEKRNAVLTAYFSDEGSAYSLTRTHMASCDFSLDHYTYAPSAGDTLLESFGIDEDREDLIPMIKDALAISSEGFKIIASPWTAPPWMKTNNAWYAGSLRPEYYSTWANYFVKYAKAYEAEGIPIWGFTVENEPLGNDSNWESMHYTPAQMADFVKHHLGPALKRNDLQQRVLLYDQNRGLELDEWSDHLLKDPQLLPYVHGTAVHWYTSTVDWYPNSLQHVHDLAPTLHLIQSEGCVDAEVPHWKDDDWYWSKEATDWGWDWAKPEDKPHHPKYVPVYRYARDMIGCMNSWVDGWIDWNMVLDRQGGPNLANNWCVAPVIVDTEMNEVYFTPLYEVMTHFSKYIRPGAKRIGFEISDEDLMATAAQNPDGSVCVVVLNMTDEPKRFSLELNGQSECIEIKGEALQTMVIEANKL